MQNIAIIVAAGKGLRCKNEPKQFMLINGKRVVYHSIDAFIAAGFEKICVVLPQNCEYEPEIKSYHQAVYTIIGGNERQNSVYNALNTLHQDKINTDSFVFVHDAARMLLHEKDLRALMFSFADDLVGGILAAPIVDTIKTIADDKICATVPRQTLVAALTPQMYRFNVLFQAYRYCITNDIKITDEASALERVGVKSKYILTEHPNPKLTHSYDISYFEYIMQERSLCRS